MTHNSTALVCTPCAWESVADCHNNTLMHGRVRKFQVVLLCMLVHRHATLFCFFWNVTKKKHSANETNSWYKLSLNCVFEPSLCFCRGILGITRCHSWAFSCQEAVLPERALYLPTFSHLSIVNKLPALPHPSLNLGPVAGADQAPGPHHDSQLSA